MVICLPMVIFLFYKLSEWITIRIDIFLVESKKNYDKAYHRVANVLFWLAFFSPLKIEIISDFDDLF